MEIEKNTPVADLMTNRAGMVKLAQLVFDKTAIPYMRAITVFATNPTLGRVIDAKRSGVFDYGECITDGPTGVRWPIDPAKTLDAIDKAEKGVLTVDDLTPLFGGNRELAEAQFGKVVPGAKVEKPKKASAKVKEESAPEKPAPAVEEKVIQFVAKEEPAPASAQPPVEPATVVFDTRKLEEQISMIGQGLAQVHDEMVLALQFLKVLRVVEENQSIINQNLKTLSAYIDPGMGLLDLVQNPNEIKLGEIVVPVAQPQQEVVTVSEVIETPATKVVRQPAPPEVETEDEEMEITEELLARLSVGDLIELANRLGLKVTGEPKYRTPILKRIRVAVGLPAVQD